MGIAGISDSNTNIDEMIVLLKRYLSCVMLSVIKKLESETISVELIKQIYAIARELDDIKMEIKPDNIKPFESWKFEKYLFETQRDSVKTSS